MENAFEAQRELNIQRLIEARANLIGLSNPLLPVNQSLKPIQVDRKPRIQARAERQSTRLKEAKEATLAAQAPAKALINCGKTLKELATDRLKELEEEELEVGIKLEEGKIMTTTAGGSAATHPPTTADAALAPALTAAVVTRLSWGSVLSEGKLFPADTTDER